MINLWILGWNLPERQVGGIRRLHLQRFGNVPGVHRIFIPAKCGRGFHTSPNEDNMYINMYGIAIQA